MKDLRKKASLAVVNNEMEYQYGKEISLSYGEAILKTKEKLKEEGFGVLTEIDVKTTMKKKLDVDYGEYVILGACNP